MVFDRQCIAISIQHHYLGSEKLHPEEIYFEIIRKKWTIITAFMLGLVLEIIQGNLLHFRSFELYDILANTLGIVLFVFLSKRVKKLLSNAVFS